MSEPSATPEPYAVHARAAGLSYICDVEPGIRRSIKGRGFSYLSAGGRRISHAPTLRRIRALAVPPAWTDVWICPDGNGHIQATGRDARGRKQYRYHDDWREVRDRNKYEHMVQFARLLPAIRERIAKDMNKRGAPREKVLATVVSLLDKTLIRVGNDEYAKDNGTYGLTTLRSSHLDIDGSELRFHFNGKSGKTWRLRVRDRRVARIVRSIQDLPGQHLFQYVDEAQVCRSIDSSDVNAYLRQITGSDVSAKDFRTWAGTVLAALALSAIGPFQSATEAKLNLRRAIEGVANRLRNTTTICRRCYIHPEIIACYLDGTLPVVRAGQHRSPVQGLPPEEGVVLRLLERRLKPRRQPMRRAASDQRLAG
ncbi:MAG TPA: DNA topoisomerase IB [Hyphomicrobiaceae bacterium]|nr:DNA topoisomerase IB [Hyphomicrobiaceae bacterium]